MNDLNTRRFPRTLREAFGPYTSERIDEPVQRVPLHEKVLYVASIVAALVIVFVR